MNYYTKAMKALKKQMAVANNFTAISMWVSIFIGLIGAVVWFINSFLFTPVLNGISLILAIFYLISLAMVCIGHILMEVYSKKMHRCQKLYRKARNRLFTNNIAVANDFYYSSIVEEQAV